MGTNDFLLGYWEPEKISIDNGNQLLNIDQCAVQFEKNLVILSLKGSVFLGFCLVLEDYYFIKH